MRRFRALIVAFLVAAFVIAIPARNSFAVMQIPYNTIVYGPLDIGGIFGLPVVEGVGVCAHDKYAAAMTALGYGGDVVTGLDADKKALLSNQSTGGAFWTFAQHFVNPSPSGNLTERMVYRYAELYGTGVVWSAEFQASEKPIAADALKTILDGGRLDGGGTSGNISETYTLDNSNRFNPDNHTYKIYGDWPNGRPSSDGSGFVWNVSITAGVKADAETYKATYPYVCVWNNFPGTLAYFDGGRSYYGYSHLSMSTSPFYLDSGGLKTDGAVVTWYDSQSIRLDITNNVVVDRAAEPWTASPGRVLAKRGWSTVGNVDTPTIPPSNWPDAPEDTTPTAPDVPAPTEPEMPAQPVQPTAPALPDFPSNIISPGSTYETFDIQAILDAMDEHCQHLQSAVYQGFSDYFDTFTPWLSQELETVRACIRGESQWQMDVLHTEFDDLQDYLWQLFQWLADQMQFTITGDSYNDSTVVSWLRRIYYKLQSSPVNTRPADPVANPDGAWDWLWQLLQDILNGLTGGAAELVGKLMNLFDGIKDKFPFSVPWDLAAVLVLLDVPAQTPAFTVSYDVFGTTVTYDIDLHFMDEYAGVIRSMETVLFCFMLIKNTKWLTGIFDEVGQFLGTKLGYRG